MCFRDLSSPSIYVKNEEFITIINNSSQEDMYYDVEESKIQDFKLLADKIQLTKGTWPIVPLNINLDIIEGFIPSI